MLVDAFGREVTDIRVSVTKRCNFGCIYCHDEGLGPILKPRMPHEDEMSVAEIERLLRVAREFGIRSVKFTGGEPLIRLDMEQIIDRSVRQLPDVSMTTNGSMLAKRAEAVRDAGLKRVNGSKAARTRSSCARCTTEGSTSSTARRSRSWTPSTTRSSA